MAVVRMIIRRDRLEIQPSFGQVEASVQTMVFGCGRDGLMDIEKRNGHGQVYDGCPESDRTWLEGERVPALHGVG